MHLARALKGRGEFQEALDVLDVAEEMSADQGRAIRVYKEEVIKAMKEHMLSFDKAKQFCDQNQMTLDDEPDINGKGEKPQAKGENKKQVKEEKAEEDKDSKKGETAKDDDSNKKSEDIISFKELQERCEKAKTTMKTAEELWTNVKEDKTSSNQERLEGLKKMAEIVGNNVQTF